jgi:DNA-directed RNA polymerase specialized sigma24 family protein
MSEYKRETVEKILPNIFYEATPLLSKTEADLTPPNHPNVVDAEAIDPIFRKGTIDPKQSGNGMATLLDVKAAFQRAGLTVSERAALLCKYALDLNVRDTGAVMAVSRNSVAGLIEEGLAKILNYLND